MFQGNDFRLMKKRNKYKMTINNIIYLIHNIIINIKQNQILEKTSDIYSNRQIYIKPNTHIRLNRMINVQMLKNVTCLHTLRQKTDRKKQTERCTGRQADNQRDGETLWSYSGGYLPRPTFGCRRSLYARVDPIFPDATGRGIFRINQREKNIHLSFVPFRLV